MASRKSTKLKAAAAAKTNSKPRKKTGPRVRRKTKRAVRGSRDVLPVEQGENEDCRDYRVGPGHPPREYQWRPGESGNPYGQPRARTNLFPLICKYFRMRESELSQLLKHKRELTMVQRTALTVVLQLQAGVVRRDVAKVMLNLIERSEGKPPIAVRIQTEEPLSEEECEEIRREYRRKFGYASDEPPAAPASDDRPAAATADASPGS